MKRFIYKLFLLSVLVFAPCMKINASTIDVDINIGVDGKDEYGIKMEEDFNDSKKDLSKSTDRAIKKFIKFVNVCLAIFGLVIIGACIVRLSKVGFFSGNPIRRSQALESLGWSFVGLMILGPCSTIVGIFFTLFW